MREIEIDDDVWLRSGGLGMPADPRAANEESDERVLGITLRLAGSQSFTISHRRIAEAH